MSLTPGDLFLIPRLAKMQTLNGARELTRSTSPTDWKEWVAVSLILVVFLVLVASVDVPINNGDWGRVTRSGGFFPAIWKPGEWSYLLVNEPILGHSSSMSVLIFMLAMVHKAMGLQEFVAASSYLALTLIFGTGLMRVVTNREIKYRYGLSVALLVVFWGYGFHLGSYFEEATVLALVPWFCQGCHDLASKKKFGIFTFSAIFIIYSKSQMLFVAPWFVFLLVVFARSGWRTWYFRLTLLVLVCATLMMANAVQKGSSLQNQYNRVFNGIGWSWLGSSAWPAKNFNERHAYYYANKHQFQEKMENDHLHWLMGTSYWPTAAQIASRAGREASNNSDSTQYRDLLAYVLEQGRPLTYLKNFVDRPELIVKYVLNIYATAVPSDYSLAYLRAGDSGAEGVDRKTTNDSLQGLVFQNLGIVCLAFMLLSWSLSPGWPMAISLGWLALSPVFVVVGDGFYEFEKHMIPYMMLIPALLAMQCARRGLGEKRA